MGRLLLCIELSLLWITCGVSHAAASSMTVDIPGWLTGDSPVHTVDPMELSFDYGSWQLQVSKFPAGGKLDVTNPAVVKMVKALGGGYQRVSGTMVDLLQLEAAPGGASVPQVDLPSAVKDKMKNQKDAIYTNMDVFAQFGTFVRESGNHLVLGLNQLTRKWPNDDSICTGAVNSCPWDDANARAWLEMARDQKIPIYALELGNEPGCYMARDQSWEHSLGITPVDAAADFVALKALVDDVYKGQSALNKPKIIGPDTGGCIKTPELSKSILSSGAGAVLDAVSFHYYAIGSAVDEAANNVLTVEEMANFALSSSTKEHFLSFVPQQKEFAPDAPLWVGEGATTCAYSDEIQNSFAMLFNDFNILREGGLSGISVFIQHQIMKYFRRCGSDEACDWQPTVFYWFAYLYKRAMASTIDGTKVFSTVGSNDKVLSSVRGQSLIMLNLGDAKELVAVQHQTLSMSYCDTHTLTPDPNNSGAAGSGFLINGETPFVPRDGSLPDVPTVRQACGAISLPSNGFVFVTLSKVQEPEPFQEIGKDFYCDSAYNFISDVKYSQISLTDGCDTSVDPPVCNRNPKYVPMYSKVPNTDAGVQYCKDTCRDPELFYDRFGLGKREDSCSECTGFFFQRHNNGHEICGFYTFDLNDAKLNRVSHGHAEGSRLCVKGKLYVNLPINSTRIENFYEDQKEENKRRRLQLLKVDNFENISETAAATAAEGEGEGENKMGARRVLQDSFSPSIDGITRGQYAEAMKGVKEVDKYIMANATSTIMQGLGWKSCGANSISYLDKGDGIWQLYFRVDISDGPPMVDTLGDLIGGDGDKMADDLGKWAGDYFNTFNETFHDNWIPGKGLYTTPPSGSPAAGPAHEPTKLQNGERCSTYDQCESNYCFIFTCAEEPVKIENGKACLSNDACQSNLCSFIGTGLYCVAPDGASCSANNECQSNHCVVDATTMTMQCGEAHLPNGATCAMNSQCQIGSYCKLMKCAARLADGANCLTDDSCQSGNCAAFTFKCAARPADFVAPYFAPEAGSGYMHDTQHGRRLEFFDESAGKVGTCMDHKCSCGYQSRNKPDVYCEGRRCTPDECCDKMQNPPKCATGSGDGDQGGDKDGGDDGSADRLSKDEGLEGKISVLTIVGASIGSIVFSFSVYWLWRRKKDRAGLNAKHASMVSIRLDENGNPMQGNRDSSFYEGDSRKDLSGDSRKGSEKGSSNEEENMHSL